MLSEQRKQQIADTVLKATQNNSSYDKLSVQIGKVASGGTLNKMANGKWDLIKDEMWNKVGARLNVRNEWQTAVTPFVNDICGFMNDAQYYQDNFWVIAQSGNGKTEAINYYRKEHKNVFVVSCRDYTKREFVYYLASELGVQKKASMRYRDLENAMIKRIQELNCPLLVFDEADKLREEALKFIIVLYNEVKNAGFFCCSTPAVEEYMKSFRKRRGGEEVFSRFGKQFLSVNEPDEHDVELICKANYITNDPAINRVKKEAQKANYDMRAVRKAILKEWRKMAV